MTNSVPTTTTVTSTISNNNTVSSNTTLYNSDTFIVARYVELTKNMIILIFN